MSFNQKKWLGVDEVVERASYFPSESIPQTPTSQIPSRPVRVLVLEIMHLQANRTSTQ